MISSNVVPENPQVSFCDKMEEIKETESMHELTLTAGGDPKPKLTFNISMDL